MVKYYTQEEIAYHNCAEDCWVIIFDNVYDITELIKANRGPLVVPLLEAAGGSVSHWFDPKTQDIKTFIDPVRNIELPYTPQGRFIHVPPPEPQDMWEAIPLPWWKDPKFIIGKVNLLINSIIMQSFTEINFCFVFLIKVSQKTMKIKITNMLTRADHIIKVCKEETLDDIKSRYLDYNFNSNSYTWKVLNNGQFVTLKSDWTLEQNGILDQSDTLLKLGMDEELYLHNLLIYYDDDLNDA